MQRLEVLKNKFFNILEEQDPNIKNNSKSESKKRKAQNKVLKLESELNQIVSEWSKSRLNSTQEKKLEERGERVRKKLFQAREECSKFQ